MPPTVELVYDAGCPNVPLARAHVARAFAQAGLPLRWREWRRDGAHAPVRLKPFGSPTILVNGRDVAPMSSAGASCRVYPQDDGTFAGVPSVDVIAQALVSARALPGRLRDAVVWLPAVGVAFLPKLFCPACWPAYAALVSALGLGFLIETVYLLPITVAALALVLGVLARDAVKHRRRGPLLLGAVAALALLVGKFAFDASAVAYVAATGLFAACAWMVIAQRRARAAPCPACVPATDGPSSKEIS